MEILWHSKVRTYQYFVHCARQNTPSAEDVYEMFMSMWKEPTARLGLDAFFSAFLFYCEFMKLLPSSNGMAYTATG